MTARSLTFVSSRSTYLQRDHTAGNQQTATIRFHIKPITSGIDHVIFDAGSNTGVRYCIFLRPDNTIELNGSLFFSGTSTSVRTATTIPNDGYFHAVTVALDTTQVTDTERVKIYFEDHSIAEPISTSGVLYPNQNVAAFRTGTWYIGYNYNSGSLTPDARLDEFYFADGQRLTPAAFQGNNYTGSYGANGFRLTFDNNASDQAFGYDTSGHALNFSAVNFQLSDSSTDVPVFPVSFVAQNIAVSAPVITTQSISREGFSPASLTVLSPVLIKPTMAQIGISKLLSSAFSVRNPDLGNPNLLSYKVATLGPNWIKTANAIVGGKFRDAHWVYNAVALIDRAGWDGPFEISQTITRANAIPSLYRISFEVAPTKARTNFELGLTDNAGGTASGIFDAETGHCFKRSSTLQDFQLLDVASEPMVHNFTRFVVLVRVRAIATLKGFIRLVDANLSSNFTGNGFRSILVGYPLLFEHNDDRTFRWEIGRPEMRFYWTVHLQHIGLQWFRSAQGQLGVDPHLLFNIPEDLECILRRWQPAQTAIVFDFSGSKLSGESDPMAGTP